MNKNRIIEICKTIAVFLGFVLAPSFIIVLLSMTGIKDEVVLTFLTELVYVLIIVFLYRHTLIKDFKSFDKKNIKLMIKWWLIGWVIMIASNAIINFVIFKGEIALNEEQNRAMLTTYPVLGLILAGVLAPILEELTFRRGFRKISDNKYVFAIVSTVVFAFLHVVPGFVIGVEPLKLDWLQLLYLLPYGSLGFSFSWLYAKTDNIFANIYIHAFHNTLTMLMVLAVY